MKFNMTKKQQQQAERIATICAEQCGLTRADLNLKCGKDSHVKPRQIAMTIIGHDLHWKDQDVAKMFNQSRPSVHHSRKCVQNRLATDKSYLELYIRITLIAEGDRQ